MDVDYLFVGGGLASSLAAYRMAARRPEIRFRVLERGPTLGGNHTWSFHEGDLTREEHEWMEALVSHRWSRYEVRFPRYRRVIEGGYLSVESADLHDRVATALGERAEFGVEIEQVTAQTATTARGAEYSATSVIDGRGYAPSEALGLGYQKFLGQVLEFDRPIDIDHPIVMDTTVEQTDGFRFVYVLPFTPRKALVEDTYYSDSPRVDAPALRDEILSYAEQSKWSVSGVQREESGVLPIVLSGDIGEFWNDSGAVARIGLRAALFHPTTGYSLPSAVRSADALADVRTRPEDAYRILRNQSERAWSSGGLFRGLNRMLYLAAEPGRHYRVLERFYRLREPLIRRFYAARLTAFDGFRILAGVPPVPVGAAIKALMDTQAGRSK
jgi:lycopene beta-cyclase